MPETNKRSSEISFSSIRKVYETADGELVALDDVSFDVGKGEFVAVLGPSGCGKSTLMLLAAGLDPITGGTLKVGGKVVDRPLTDIGIVFQDHALYDWRTILDNIMLQAELRRLPAASMRARALELLERTGLSDFATKLPHELSGGMRQRASICRALVHDPSFLFFDEPFGALDALTREQMRIDLEKLWLERRPTVLFITHGIGEAVALSDRIVIMTARPGKVDTIINIDLPRPRTKDVLQSAAYDEYVEMITDRFISSGVLKY
ncbi:ABC transporter ATP-binding protein [Bosea sp. (in: a-proteobacteria)]|uniref:ABC transporter ATP-binding protein n=1 Tax=Bosea sp. (in: a-proteobacteria) TaxID=1871050 RepID=UPI00260C82CE|nr:ABC transporter ATP-binding protein [Bosea sp. (in: a-proteobacteria)]MCO5090338.1 ABC transporter ATP-binding protein [Bosea sp. (in: a-proteobacteria)]